METGELNRVKSYRTLDEVLQFTDITCHSYLTKISVASAEWFLSVVHSPRVLVHIMPHENRNIFRRSRKGGRNTERPQVVKQIILN